MKIFFPKEIASEDLGVEKIIIIMKERRECDTKRSCPLTLELLSPSRKAKNINTITRKKDERDLSLSQRQVISSVFPSNTYQSTQQSSLHISFHR